MTIVYLRDQSSAAEIQTLCNRLIECGMRFDRPVRGPARLILSESLIPPRLVGFLRDHPAVDEVELTESLPQRVLRTQTEGSTRPLVRSDDIIDFREPEMIAGPCAVESASSLDEIAGRLSELGVRLLRGGGDKVRSSPLSFRGLGLEGYRILGETARRYGMLAVSEVVDSDHLRQAADQLDILQVGARNMHNPQFLERVGALEKPVLLKRGFSATYSEWLWAGEYVLAAGATFLLFCERGIRTFSPGRRFTLDLQAIPLLQEMSAFPVLVDPSHAAGASPFVTPLARAAVAAGANGLLIECHSDPAVARCDAHQALTLDALENLISSLHGELKPSPVDPTPRSPVSVAQRSAQGEIEWPEIMPPPFASS